MGQGLSPGPSTSTSERQRITPSTMDSSEITARKAPSMKKKSKKRSKSKKRKQEVVVGDEDVDPPRQNERTNVQPTKKKRKRKKKRKSSVSENGGDGKASTEVVDADAEASFKDYSDAAMDDIENSASRLMEAESATRRRSIPPRKRYRMLELSQPSEETPGDDRVNNQGGATIGRKRPRVEEIETNNDSDSESKSVGDGTYIGLKRREFEELRWQKMFEEIKEFRDENGEHTTIVPRFVGRESKLGNWVNNQRKKYHNGKLEPQRIEALNSINFVWTVHCSWRDMYEKLLAYKEQHGHTNVPQSYKHDRRLGKWVNNQRNRLGPRGKPSEKKKEEREEQVRLLNEIGFVWVTKKTKRKSKNTASTQPATPGAKGQSRKVAAIQPANPQDEEDSAPTSPTSPHVPV